jgi:predicted TIM-barrel fold metal-dependent hydrolase
MIIDAYTHCGVDKFQPLPDVQAMMRSVGIAKAVLAQHLGQFDNSYIESCVRSSPETLAGVAMIDARAPTAHSALDAVMASGAFRGLRMTAEMLVSAPGIASVAIEGGLNVVLYCPDGTTVIAAVLGEIAPGPGRIVITHLGCPQVTDDAMTRGEEILTLAADPRVLVTLSGAGMACLAPHAPLQALVRSVVSEFGAERVMWASNFPVTGDAEAVAADLCLLQDNAWGLDPSVIEDIQGTVANRIWFTDRGEGAA